MSLDWRIWDGESVVFSTLQATAFLLSPEATEVFGALCDSQGALGLDAINELVFADEARLGEAPTLFGHTDADNGLHDVLARLERIGIVERIPIC